MADNHSTDKNRESQIEAGWLNQISHQVNWLGEVYNLLIELSQQKQFPHLKTENSRGTK